MSKASKGLHLAGCNYLYRQKVEELSAQYEHNWGKKIDETFIPPVKSHETMILILERIVETGESLLVGYNKIMEQQKRKANSNE